MKLNKNQIKIRATALNRDRFTCLRNQAMEWLRENDNQEYFSAAFRGYFAEQDEQRI